MFAIRSMTTAFIAASVLAGSTWAATPGWVWLDAQGHKVFSDMPPPSDIPASKIIRQPGAMAMPPTPQTEPEKPETKSNAKQPAQNPKSPSTEEPPKADAQRKAIEKRNAEIRVDNCDRARTALTTLSTGGRLATVNEQGQRVIMDQAMKDAERARLDRIIADNCR